MARRQLWWITMVTALVAGFVPAAQAVPAGQPTDILVAVIADAPPTRAGTTAPAGGTIYAAGTGVAGLSVHLQMRPHGSTAFTTVGTVVSGPSGALSTSTPALYHNTEFRWQFDGDASYDPTTSSTWVEYVSPRVRIRVSDRTPAIGQRVVVHGRTHPSKAGNRVSVWRGTKPFLGYGPATHHVRLVRGHVRADGSYRLVVRFSAAARVRIYVQVGSGGGNVAGYSAYRWLSVH